MPHTNPNLNPNYAVIYREIGYGPLFEVDSSFVPDCAVITIDNTNSDIYRPGALFTKGRKRWSVIQ